MSTQYWDELSKNILYDNIIPILVYQANISVQYYTKIEPIIIINSDIENKFNAPVGKFIVHSLCEMEAFLQNSITIISEPM